MSKSWRYYKLQAIISVNSPTIKHNNLTYDQV